MIVLNAFKLDIDINRTFSSQIRRPEESISALLTLTGCESPCLVIGFCREKPHPKPMEITKNPYHTHLQKQYSISN